jgi:hypothetical protein
MTEPDMHDDPEAADAEPGDVAADDTDTEADEADNEG